MEIKENWAAFGCMSGCFDRASALTVLTNRQTKHCAWCWCTEDTTCYSTCCIQWCQTQNQSNNLQRPQNANMQNRTVFGECRENPWKKPQYLQIYDSYILLNHRFLVHESTRTAITKDPCSRFLRVTGDGINQKCKEVIKENALNRSYGVDDE